MAGTPGNASASLPEPGLKRAHERIDVPPLESQRGREDDLRAYRPHQGARVASVRRDACRVALRWIDRLASNLIPDEIDSDHQALAAHVADRRKAIDEGLKLIEQIRALPASI